MLRSWCWIGQLSILMLIAFSGCSIARRPNALAGRQMPPDKMMAMAQNFERHGQMRQAKSAYAHVLSVQPDNAEARKSLDALIASDANRNWFGISKSQGKSRADNSNANPAPRLIAQGSEANSSDIKPIELSESAAKLPELDASPRVIEPETVAKNDTSVPPEPLTADSNDSLALREEPPLSDLSPSQGGAEAIETIPDLSSTVNPPAASARPRDITEPIPSFTETLPELADRPAGDVRMQSPNVTIDQSLPSAESPFKEVDPGFPVAGVTDVELSKLFGSFQIEMIQILRENRERFQPKLVEIACDREAEVETRSRAIFLLGAIGHQAIDALPALRHQMHEGADPFMKVDFCEAILKIQPEDEDAIRVLVDCLNDSNSEVRWIAVFALRSSVSSRTTYVIDSLREVLKTDDLKLQRMVFLTLAEFGPAASAALPEIYQALDSQDRATREVAKASLESIAPGHSLKSALD